MCHYITAILPQRAAVDALAGIAHRHSRQLAPQANDGIEEMLRPDEAYYLTTAGHCDCGTALGALARGKHTDGHELETRRLRAKGWSEAKISRWLEQKQLASERIAVGRRKRGEPDLRQWLEFLTETLQSGHTPYIGILIHWYSGPLTERIRVQGRETSEFSALSIERLGHIREDIIYEFRAPRA